MCAKFKKSLFVFIAAILVAAFSPIHKVALADSKAEELTPTAPKSIEREHKFVSGVEPSEFEQLITDENGNEYRLVSIGEAVEDLEYTSPTQHYTQQITKDIPREDIIKLDDYCPASLYIEDGWFIGNIGHAAHPYDTINIYESFTGQVDREYTINGLLDNDVARLPKQMEFEISSDAEFGATQIATLDLLSVNYEVTGTNSLGMPNEYAAHLVYRGQQSWLELHHYSVAANYAGEVPSSERQYVIKAQYELMDKPAAAAPVVSRSARPVSIPAVEAPLAAPDSNVPIVAVALVVIVMAALALLLLWLLLWRKNAVLVRTLDGKRKVLLRRHLNVIEGKAKFVVPERIQLMNQASYVLELKPWLTDKKGEIEVMWHGRIIAKDALQPSIGIDVSGIKSEPVLAAITECLIDVAEIPAK
jgi:hypothetical protein